MRPISDWFRRFLNDPQAVVLVMLLVLVATVVIFMGRMLAPVFASIVIAYLLEGLVQFLRRLSIPRMLAVTIVFILFSAFMLIMIVGLLPLLSRQLIQLVQQFPTMFNRGYQFLENLPTLYPGFVSEAQVLELTNTIKTELAGLSQQVLTWSVASVVGIITISIYLVLVPLLVFFFLKDKTRILRWFKEFLPQDYTLAQQVWGEVDLQIGNYVRGKFWEILIVWAASFAVFTYMGLQFAMLLGLVVGLSVIVPYVGAIVATVPVAVVGFFQWGWSAEFMWLMGAYALIQFLDGNVLVPLLFSEVVDLHPIAIIVAVLVFGGLWGFWGVFFAIPLATVVQAVLKAWPRRKKLSVFHDKSRVDEDEAPVSEDIRGEFRQT